ncbi:serine/threonine protein kinase [Cohnella luojiensis]|uniref:non-specific serine/threonine protein kinase n=1 Tax=Cohnella luojiensis TaxID=652876 RepID=A0A4Y8LY99_9BACL|nr:serine/threonine-protein kinase [Cohnella luojiensis]TFE24891.1 serine/threonine protein kinase [Cohnella luojiensis]
MEDHRLAGLELTPGQLYGERYRIVMPIGKGGMGRVYLAEDIRVGGKHRALKLTRPLPDERRTFLPEAQMLSELDHPNLPAIVDYYPPDADGVTCIVMDYIAGDSVAERFERYGFKLAYALVLSVMADLCDVLVYLHAQNPPIVFRDLKPSNVLLDRQNRAILVDFGIARRYREEGLSDTLQLGTPGFAAPEQLRGEQSDRRTDIYGLGAFAYHLLSGGLFAYKQRGGLKRDLQSDVPAEFIKILERMLENDPEKRPQTAYDLSAELKSIQEGSPRIYRSSSCARDNEITDKVSVIAITSAYPGAGATFATLALSSSLWRRGIAHAVVECPGNEPEIYALLDGSSRMPKGALYAQAYGQQAAFPVWRHGHAAYYPLNPNETVSRIPEREFAEWLRRLGVPIVLLDVSGRSDLRDNIGWIVRTVDHIGLVADCYPSKWTTRRQSACMELQRQARQHRVRSVWIANRDQPFPDRKQWHSLFPAKPDVYLPELPSEVMLNALWRGTGIPTYSPVSSVIDESFHKWIPSVMKQR